LREAALPFLQDLYNATRTTVQLGVLRDTQALVVEKITGHRALRMLSRVGGLVPAHCSALGRAILAWSPPEILERIHEAGLPARTPRTVTSGDAVRESSQPRGVAAAPEEHGEGNVGVSCVAAPLSAARRGGGGGVRDRSKETFMTLGGGYLLRSRAGDADPGDRAEHHARGQRRDHR